MGDAEGKKSTLVARSELSQSLSQILTRARTPETFAEWLKAKKLFYPIDLALLAIDEANIEKKILLVCKEKITDYAEPDVEVAIRKAWSFCRDSMKTKDDPEKKELDINDTLDLDERWNYLYGIPLSTREKVGRILLTKLFKMVSLQPPDFEIFMLEQITLHATIGKSVQQVVTGPGNTLQTQQLQVTPNSNANAVYEKIKALLFSIAYVSTGRPDWCTFGQTRATVEVLWVAIQKAEEQGAPLSWFNDAYLATMQVLQTQVCTFGSTLTEALSHTSSWLVFWTYNGGGSAGAHVEHTHRQSRRQMQNALWQTMARFNQKHVGKGTGKNRKGKGKGKGKDSWKTKNKFDKRGGKHGGKGDWGSRGAKSGGKGDWNHGGKGNKGGKGDKGWKKNGW